MADRHEKTHGGFGPTRKEWEDDIFPDIKERALRECVSFIKSTDAVAALGKNADKVYSYTGKQHRSTRLALRKLYQMIVQKIYIEAKAHEYRSLRLEALEQRVKALDGIAVSKSLDVEAFDSLVDMAGRVENLETTLRQIADGAIRYRGYWQEGDVAQKGDAFSHNGSTYRANTETETEPGTAGGAWTTLARGAPKGTR